MATTRLNDKLKSKKRNHKEEEGGCKPATKKSSKRFQKRKRITLKEADVVDLWVTVGRSNGLTTDVDIARFLISL